ISGVNIPAKKRTFALDMRRRIPQEKKFISEVRSIDIAEEGKGVAKQDEMVLFSEGAVPGDVAGAELRRKKKNIAEGRVTALKQASEYRIDPFCPHFGTCGGCKWQHMDYQAQLHFKQQSVGNALKRLGKV